jgi:hypothetical protein
VKKARYDKELEREKEKLNKLVGEAFNKGTPFTEDEAVFLYWGGSSLFIYQCPSNMHSFVEFWGKIIFCIPCN